MAEYTRTAQSKYVLRVTWLCVLKIKQALFQVKERTLQETLVISI